MKQSETKISECCGQPTEIHADAEVVYFVCTGCREECDVKSEPNELMKWADNIYDKYLENGK